MWIDGIILERWIVWIGFELIRSDGESDQIAVDTFTSYCIQLTDMSTLIHGSPVQTGQTLGPDFPLKGMVLKSI